jgi:diguanylate cyclase (GGDEF)-like protein
MASARRRFLGIIIFAGIFVALCLACVLFLSPQQSAIASDIYSPLAGVLVTALLWHTARVSRRISPRVGRAWQIIAIAQAVFALGDLIWAVYEVGLGLDPYPSAADIFYILYYPLFFAGIVLLSTRGFSPEEWVRKGLDVGTALITSILIFWTLLIGPIAAANSTEPVLVQILAIAYPVGDLLLIWALLTILLTQHKLRNSTPVILISLALLVLISTDMIYSFQSLVGDYVSGSLLDLGWIAATLLTGIAAARQCQKARETPEEEKLSTISEKPSGWARLPTHIPYVFMIFSFLLLIRRYYVEMPISFLTLALAVGSINLLILFRQMMTLIENRRLFNQLSFTMHQLQNQAGELEKSNQELLIEINERKRAERQLVYDGLHDNLTGLPNRLLFIDRLERAIQETIQEKDEAYSVLFLDLDDFKVKNESLGHTLGDQLLILFCERLKSCLRYSDTIARMGGDEFVILLSNTREEQASIHIAGRIQDALRRPFDLGGNQVVTTTSIGIVPHLAGYTHPEELLRDADIALYHAKTLGKARYAVFTPGLLTQAMTRMQLETEIRYAIEENELRLYYQPIFSLASETIAGFEALIRWQHPRRGFLPPSEFLPIAEETGLIVEIGQWVLQYACVQVKAWHTQFPALGNLSISVNISGLQFSQADFPEQVLTVLHATGLPAEALHLEITENIFIENPAIVSGYFNRLRDLGIQLHIDDFQTGYSSLRYLQDFPVQCIKIDKAFVQEIGKQTKNAELVPTMISMAQTMGMDSIAEGVETRDQLRELQRLGCPYAQGYLLAMPMDSSSAERFLASHLPLTGPAARYSSQSLTPNLSA